MKENRWKSYLETTIAITVLISSIVAVIFFHSDLSKASDNINSKIFQSTMVRPSKESPTMTDKDLLVKKNTLKSVNSASEAEAWLDKNCPRIKFSTIEGNTSYYQINYGSIQLGETVPKHMINLALAHELAHHFQWHSYNGDFEKWDNDATSHDDKPAVIEVQADQMAYEMVGHMINIAAYTQELAKGEQKKIDNQLIDSGLRNSCF